MGAQVEMQRAGHDNLLERIELYSAMLTINAKMLMCQLPIFRTDLKYTKSPCSCQPILHRSKII